MWFVMLIWTILIKNLQLNLMDFTKYGQNDSLLGSNVGSLFTLLYLYIYKVTIVLNKSSFDPRPSEAFSVTHPPKGGGFVPTLT